MSKFEEEQEVNNMDNEFVNEKIYYQRYEHSDSDEIILKDGKWQVSRTTTTKGYDSLMGNWVTLQKAVKFLSLSEIGLFKSLNQVVFVRRTAIDSMLKTVELWLKVVRKISVKDLDNNIYLTESDNRIFQTDFNITCPISQNSTPQGLKIEKISETPLTKEELQKFSEDLSNEKLLAKPIIAEELQSGEIRLIC